jgi:hypothetical protein
MLEIESLVNRIGAQTTGHSLMVVESIKYLNDRGDEDSIDNAHPIDGIVQIVTANEDEVKEGILMPNDLICFFDENIINYNKLKNENYLLYDNKKYVIHEVIHEIGHVEVHAKKV